MTFGLRGTSSIAIIGGGLSGVNAGVQLKNKGINCFTIFERNADFGGVWFQNKYPGCSVDIPSLLYCYSYDLKQYANGTYGTFAENQKYIDRVASKHGLSRHTRFLTVVRQLTWKEDRGQWQVIVVKNKTCQVQDKGTQDREIEDILYFQFV